MQQSSLCRLSAACVCVSVLGTGEPADRRASHMQPLRSTPTQATGACVSRMSKPLSDESRVASALTAVPTS